MQATLPVSASADRTAGLRRVLEDPATLRSVFFIKGMSCRACTIIIDRHLMQKEGVHWERFNYPLRLLFIYHDPRQFPVSAAKDFIDATGELTAVLLESRPVKELRPEKGAAVATWKGGSLSPGEAKEARSPFEKSILDYMIEEGTNEWNQVAFEIAGEAVRIRIFRALAEAEGFQGDSGGVEQPVVLAKDFYWPLEMLPLTDEEAMVARYIRENILLGDETEIGRERFDKWLFELWKEIALDFRGEGLELFD